MRHHLLRIAACLIPLLATLWAHENAATALTAKAAVDPTSPAAPKMVAFVKKLETLGLSEKASGDPVAGSMVYEKKGGCRACHSIGSDGGNPGPDLSDVGRQRNLKYLEESIVTPEADVPIRYRAVQVVTKSAQTIDGIRLNEDDVSIQLRDEVECRGLPEFLARHAMRISVVPILAAMTLVAQSQPVTYDRLLKADQEPGNWLMYSNTYNSWRFSRLDQINTQNVKNLRVKWLFQGRSPDKFETTPLVVDGIMYLTRPENDVFALDAETGRVMWTYHHKNPEKTYNCCGKVNRGLAILDNRLFMSTLDMHLIALDAKSGRELWKTEMYDYTASGGYAATGAPLVVKDRVIVGMAGGEHPVSGFLDAYDAATGKRLWRFNTIPQPGEANFGTWAGDSWKTGGVSTWNNGSYDPETNTLYWGISNPWPDYNRDFREGDNLYSCSVLALDPDSGKLKWYFQFTPHDTHDWDATQIPILIDAPFRDRPRKLMAWAARNGFYYLLDRTSGEFLLAKNFVRQTWAKGFDDKGRPEFLPGTDPTPEGLDTVFPGVDGGANWMSHSYSPLTRLLYVFARDERRVFTKNTIRHAGPDDDSVTPAATNAAASPAGGRGGRGGRTTDGDAQVGNGIFGAGGNVPGAGLGGGRGRPRFTPEESWGKVVAIDPLSGVTKWEHKVLTPPWGGVMSTAGNLVFGGTQEGVVFALDARSGERLWYFAGNERVYASPISYLANGKQYVSLAVGDVLITFGL